KLLDLRGAVVTIDAMGCQKDIAAGIDQGGGKYLLAVKENQPHLYEDIQKAFDEALDKGEPGVDFTECHTEEVHGSRHETRTCCVIKNPSGIRNAGLWVNLTAICMVLSDREVNGIRSSEIRYYIGSVNGPAIVRRTFPGCARWRCVCSRPRKKVKERASTVAASWRGGKTSTC